MRQWPLQIVDRKLPIDHLLSVVRALSRQNPVRLLVVDYIQRYGQRDQIDPVVDRLVEFAKAENVAVLVCSQITKTHTDKGGLDKGRPSLYSLKESTTIAEAAAVVWILWRPERDGHSEVTRADGSAIQTDGLAELMCVKNADGPVMDDIMRFDEQYFRFVEV